MFIFRESVSRLRQELTEAQRSELARTDRNFEDGRSTSQL